MCEVAGTVAIGNAVQLRWKHFRLLIFYILLLEAVFVEWVIDERYWEGLFITQESEAYTYNV